MVISRKVWWLDIRVSGGQIQECLVVGSKSVWWSDLGMFGGWI